MPFLHTRHLVLAAALSSVCGCATESSSRAELEELKGELRAMRETQARLSQKIERLEQGSPVALERVGGKAAGLVRLLDAGLDVPEAWVIPAGERATKRELAAWWSETGKGGAWAVRRQLR